ncbi:MAG: hypothetical protein B7Y71_01350, partial [Xanthobacter sp. 35-67-6]
LGLHFFSPAHVMKLVEVIRAGTTSAATLATALRLAARLKKIPVLAGVCDGFIGNRILTRYRQTCDIMLMEGALPAQVDQALRGFGMAMGPYEVQDLSGLDIAYANRKRLGWRTKDGFRYIPIADRIVEETGRLGRKDSSYTCKVNGIPLTFNESAAVNFNYPWRDNFCELRDFHVGQCPGGYGHQGEDIKPGNCVMNNEGSDRCLPYQHTIAAVRDGLIWRLPGNLAAYLVINTPNEFVRFRYLHMNPKYMDEDGLISGRQVSQGEIIGKVATWGDFENGTSYHLHFNMQVMTKVGWVWVNPYMSLVLAYEKMIGGRGTELHEGDPVPAAPDKPPVVLHPPVIPQPKPVAAEAVSAKTTDAKTTDPKTTDEKTTDAKTTDAKTTDAKTTDAKTTDAKADLTDTKPAVEPDTKPGASAGASAKAEPATQPSSNGAETTPAGGK